MRFLDTINSNFGFALGTLASYGIGHVYGAVHHLDKTMAARAFAISAAAALIFKVLVDLVTGGKYGEMKATYYAWHLIGTAALATIQILAFRHLNLIGNLGTACLALNATLLVLKNLHGYCNKS